MIRTTDVRFRLKQRRTLYRPAFVAPTETDYDTASDEEKAYCHATENDEDTFDNGDESYKIVE